jgi:hypothetical protein
MNTAFKPLSWLLIGSVLGLAASGTAAAQDSPAAAPKSTAQIDAGEPRANTSPTSTDPASAPSRPGTPTGATPATTPAATPRPAPRATSARPVTASGRAAPVDRVDLAAATVTGDREQPKVMYIVPWKRSDIGDLSGKPMNSLLDEALAPVDRDEFKREVAYYDAVKPNSSQNGASNPAANQGEK